MTRSLRSEFVAKNKTTNIKMMNLVLYISTSVWVLRTPNTGKNIVFLHFSCQNAEKGEKA